MAEEPVTRGARRWWVGGAALAVLAVGVVVAVSASGDDDEPAARATTTPSATAVTTAAATPSATPAPAGPAPTVPPTSSAEPRPAPTASGGPAVVVPVPPIGDRTPTVAPPEGVAEVGGVGVAVQVESVTSQGNGPGEVSGPAYALTVVLTNSSDEAYDPATLQVSLYAGADGVPLATVDSDPRAATPSAPLAPGKRATATYVFVAPDPQVLPLAAVVDLSPRLAPVVHQGLTPR